MLKRRIHAIIHGTVQGVYFRVNTEAQARSLHLKGWVRNLKDGTVECVAEGTEQDLKQLISWWQSHPGHSRVTDIRLDWLPASGEWEAFQVVRTATQAGDDPT